MLKKICIALIVVVVAAVVIVAVQPSSFRVTRTARMSARPAVIFDEVNDFHRWDRWSPWSKIDPAMKKTYEGPSAGVGAIYNWSGNSEVGKGRMEILESRPGGAVKIKLDFLEPFQASDVSEFTFVPEGEQTLVTWSMSGKNNFLLKAVSLFMGMDKMVGGDFEKGLAQLKAQVESAPKP